MASEQNDVICFFNSCKAWGGGEKWHLEMAIRLFQNGFKVVVCAAPESRLFQRAISAGIPVYGFNIGNFGFLNLRLRKKLTAFFVEHSVKHLILNLPADLKCAGLAAKQARVSDIVYRRGSAIAVKNSLFNQYLFKNVVHRIIANSKETKRTILTNNRNLIAAEKIHVIYNGIDIKRFDEQVVEEKTTNNDKIIIGNLGRLEPQKNQMFLLHVLKRVRAQGVNAMLRIGGSGRLENELQTEIQKLELSSYVEMPGFIDDVKSFMTQIDIFALSSLWEGFGYVLIEAQACYKPVVAFNVSSNPEVLTKGGVLVPVNDEEAFAQAIIDLSNNKRKAKEIGKDGRSFVTECFDINQTTQNLIQFLNK